MGNSDRKGYEDRSQTYEESVAQHNRIYAKQRVEHVRRKAKEKEEEIKEKTLALQQEREKTRAAYEEKKKKNEEIKLKELEDYRKQQKFNKRMELINKIDECKKIIIIAVCIALVPLILIVTNLESFGVVGTIILAFLTVFVVLGKGTGGFLPFFLLIFVPFGMAIALGVFVTLWWLGWIGIAFGIGIVHYRDLKKYKQELIEVLQ
ncbi:hypothetical protein [Paenibacillus sp. Y412MC10]|uniref:hypothetical protein n=1 Tax=Geobacillus sp. (strain Y412MC10) TaxID=481743 RepID=UPI0011AB51A7|nr:hypothetical protein [Paenibacillus sp. Y412MC10]